jgi:hypothetical protein
MAALTKAQGGLDTRHIRTIYQHQERWRKTSSSLRRGEVNDPYCEILLTSWLEINRQSVGAGLRDDNVVAINYNAQFSVGHGANLHAKNGTGRNSSM